MAKRKIAADNLARALIVSAGLGGVGKSTYVAGLADTFEMAGVPLDILQIDEQTKLARMTGQPVTTIDLAVFHRAREDGWAAQQAVAPLFHALVDMPTTKRWFACEIGGAMSAITHDVLRLVDIAEEVTDLGLAIDTHVLVVATEESAKQAMREIERARETIPEGRIVLVCNGRHGSVRRFLESSDPSVAKPLLDIMQELPVVNMGRLDPRTIQIWERLCVRPSQLARWRVEGGYQKICAETGLDRLEAKLFAGEIVAWAYTIRQQLAAIYPVLGGGSRA